MLTRKDFPTRRIILKCACGRELAPARASHEFTVRVERECDCGLKLQVDLELDGWEGDLPVYKVRRASVI